jgi:hypothetical protein
LIGLDRFCDYYDRQMQFPAMDRLIKLEFRADGQ